MDEREPIDMAGFAADAALYRSFMLHAVRTLARRIADIDPAAQLFLYAFAENALPEASNSMATDLALRQELEMLAAEIHRLARSVGPRSKHPLGSDGGGADQQAGIAPSHVQRGPKV